LVVVAVGINRKTTEFIRSTGAPSRSARQERQRPSTEGGEVTRELLIACRAWPLVALLAGLLGEA